MANKHTAYTYVTNTEAQCSKCKKIKLHSCFHKNKAYIHRKGVAYYCKECACKNARKNHNERIKKDPQYKQLKRDNYLKATYGITEQEYKQKVLKQKLCAICNIDLTVLPASMVHLDHCHKTNELREFLCGNCNRGIGSFHDEIWKMEKAIKYVLKHKASFGGLKEGRCL